jgi:hypothetical protein
MGMRLITSGIGIVNCTGNGIVAIQRKRRRLELVNCTGNGIVAIQRKRRRLELVNCAGNGIVAIQKKAVNPRIMDIADNILGGEITNHQRNVPEEQQTGLSLKTTQMTA